MLQSERVEIIEYLTENHGFVKEELELLNEFQLQEKYDAFLPRKAAEEVVTKEEETVHECDCNDKFVEVLDKIVEKISLLDSYPEWINEIPDAEIKDIAIEKHSVTAESLLDYIEELKTQYE